MTGRFQRRVCRVESRYSTFSKQNASKDLSSLGAPYPSQMLLRRVPITEQPWCLRILRLAGIFSGPGSLARHKK